MPYVFAPFIGCSRTAEGAALSSAWGVFLDGLLSHGSPSDEWPPYTPQRLERIILGNFYGNRSATWVHRSRDRINGSCALWDELTYVASPELGA